MDFKCGISSKVTVPSVPTPMAAVTSEKPPATIKIDLPSGEFQYIKWNDDLDIKVSFGFSPIQHNSNHNAPPYLKQLEFKKKGAYQKLRAKFSVRGRIIVTETDAQ